MVCDLCILLNQSKGGLELQKIVQLSHWFFAFLQNVGVLNITDLSLLLSGHSGNCSSCVPLEVTTLLFNLELAIQLFEIWFLSNKETGGRKVEGTTCFSTKLFHVSVSSTRVHSSFQHKKLWLVIHQSKQEQLVCVRIWKNVDILLLCRYLKALACMVLFWVGLVIFNLLTISAFCL